MRISLVRKIHGIRANSVAAVELSRLIDENRMAILHPYAGSNRNEPAARETARDVINDFFDVYNTLPVHRIKPQAPALPAASVLLRDPLALLGIPSSHQEYLKLIGDKTRNMIRKAEKQGYEFKEFAWNDHLEEIFAINTSKEVRQGEKMRDWYRKEVKPRFHSNDNYKYYGAFKEGKLYAYAHLVRCGDFAFFRHFLGHAAHLKYGIMNGLISWLVKEHIGHRRIQWLKYGPLHDTAKKSMELFRKHAGFKGYAVFIDLDHDQELLTLSQNIYSRP